MAKFRKMARKSRQEPANQQFTFEPGGKAAPVPKPEAAKVKRRRLKLTT